MERTISIINTFINLSKLEYHHNFLEFGKNADIVPLGLQLKKSPSLFGLASQDFGECWRQVLETAQSQLLTLLLLQYRDRLPGAQKAAYDILQQFRLDLTREELEHIRDRIQETNEALHRTRVSKASNLCRKAGLEWTRNRAAQLSTTSHHRNCLFNGTDLPNRVTTRAIGQDNLEVERRPEIRENVNVEEEVPATVQRVEEDENGKWQIGWTICQWECGESITEGTFGGRRESSFERPEVFTHPH